MSRPISEEIRAAREGSAGWLIQRLTGQLDRAMEGELAPHGLSIQAFAIVMTVLERDGMTQADIGARFKSPAYAVTRAIDTLEADGFVERRAHPTSRRTNTVHATAKAKTLAPTLIAIVSKVNGRLMAGLDDQDAAKTCSLLRAMLDTNTMLDATSD